MATVSASKSSEKSHSQFPEIVLTNDSLTDIINMIKQGDIVALYNNAVSHVFHNIKNVDLSKRRVVYIDHASLPHLLNVYEWEWQMREEIPNVVELPEGELNSKIMEQSDEVLNKRYFSIR